MDRAADHYVQKDKDKERGERQPPAPARAGGETWEGKADRQEHGHLGQFQRVEERQVPERRRVAVQGERGRGPQEQDNERRVRARAEVGRRIPPDWPGQPPAEAVEDKEQGRGHKPLAGRGPGRGEFRQAGHPGRGFHGEHQQQQTQPERVPGRGQPCGQERLAAPEQDKMQQEQQRPGEPAPADQQHAAAGQGLAGQGQPGERQQDEQRAGEPRPGQPAGERGESGRGQAGEDEKGRGQVTPVEVPVQVAIAAHKPPTERPGEHQVDHPRPAGQGRVRVLLQPPGGAQPGPGHQGAAEKHPVGQSQRARRQGGLGKEGESRARLQHQAEADQAAPPLAHAQPDQGRALERPGGRGPGRVQAERDGQAGKDQA